MVSVKFCWSRAADSQNDDPNKSITFGPFARVEMVEENLFGHIDLLDPEPVRIARYCTSEGAWLVDGTYFYSMDIEST